VTFSVSWLVPGQMGTRCFVGLSISAFTLGSIEEEVWPLSVIVILCDTSQILFPVFLFLQLWLQLGKRRRNGCGSRDMQ
jgi:hypothetical protein